MSRKIRAIANNENISQLRFQLYKKAHERINESIEKGFYLEAITLIESLISDRLESRISFLTDSNFGFEALGTLIKKIKVIEEDDEFKEIVSIELDRWRIKRNEALHQMAKIDIDNLQTWESKIIDLKEISINGNDLLKKIKSREQKLRRQSQ